MRNTDTPLRGATRVVAFSIALVFLMVVSPSSARDQSSLGGLDVSADRVPDWYDLDNFPLDTSYWNVVDVRTLGVTLSDGNDDSSALNSAIRSAAPNTVLYVPAGTLDIDGRIWIQRSDIVIRGAGAAQTTLRCRMNDACLLAEKQVAFFSNSRSWVGGYTKGSRVLTLSSVSGFSVGDWVSLRADFHHSTSGFQAGAYYGYKTKIVAVDPSRSQITVDRPVRQDMTGSNRVVERFEPYVHIGLEHFTLNQAVALQLYRPPILVEGVADSWLIGMRWTGNYSNEFMKLEESARVLIRGNIFGTLHKPDRWNKAGIYVNSGAYDNVIENNAFENAPISIEIQQGAAGNVVAYNFHREPTAASGCERTNFLHGGPSHDNLFEGTDGVCSNHVDNYYGGHFVGNTFFRVRQRIGSAGGASNFYASMGTHVDNRIENHGVLYLANSAYRLGGSPQMGRCIDNFSHNTVIVGNLYQAELKIDDCFDPGTRVNTHAADNYQGQVTPSTWRQQRNIPDSLYRSGPPSWWCQESGGWPSIGADADDFSGTLSTLPAERLLNNQSCTTTQGSWFPPPVLRGN